MDFRLKYKKLKTKKGLFKQKIVDMYYVFIWGTRVYSTYIFFLSSTFFFISNHPYNWNIPVPFFVKYQMQPRRAKLSILIFKHKIKPNTFSLYVKIALFLEHFKNEIHFNFFSHWMLCKTISSSSQKLKHTAK